MGSNQQAPQIPPDLKAFNQRLVEEIRANGGRIVNGPLAGSRPMVLTTTGAKSGVPRTVVIGFRADGDRYLAIASNNGNDRPPLWYLNLLENPIVTVEVGGKGFQARATTAGADERPRLAPKIEYLERQQALTSREIPIVVFERIS